jgi:Fe-S-cluster containining protein
MFEAKAAALGLIAKVDPAPGGGGWVKFAEHAGERCPMLDDTTYACRIYEDRPQRCRSFPERPTPGCAISGWEDA